MSETPDHFKTITQIAKRIKSGRLKSSEVTRSTLERIDRLDGELKSYATVTSVGHAYEQATGSISESSRTSSTRLRLNFL